MGVTTLTTSLTKMCGKSLLLAVAAVILAQASAESWMLAIGTSNITDAGTDASIWIQLHGENGDSEKMEMDSPKDNFERNSMDLFSFETKDLGTINYITLSADRYLHGTWHPAQLTLESKNGPYYYFPVNQWLLAPLVVTPLKKRMRNLHEGVDISRHQNVQNS